MAAHIFARLSKRILHQCCSPDQGSKILPFVWKLGMLPVGEALLAEHKLHPKIQRCHSNTGPIAHRESMRHSDISPISVCPEGRARDQNPRPMPDMFLLTSSDIFWHLLTSIGDLGVNAVASEEFSPRVPSWGVPPPAIAGEDAAEKEKVREEGWGGPGLAEHKRYKNGRSFKHSKAEDKICMSLYGINQQGGGWCRAAGAPSQCEIFRNIDDMVWLCGDMVMCKESKRL